MSRYKVWDKTSRVITPIGEVLTAEQWIERYPVAEALDTVCGGGAVNGAYFGVYDQMVEVYEKEGCDFSACVSKQEYLDAIEAFEDERNQPDPTYVDDNTRIADALEDLVVLRETEGA